MASVKAYVSFDALLASMVVMRELCTNFLWANKYT